MDQKELPLIGVIEGPKAVDTATVKQCKTFRSVCRMAWALRRIRNLTYRTLAERAGFYAPHVSNWFNPDDKPGRMEMPARCVSVFEQVVGNTLVSQWLAWQSGLTVLEEMQANIKQERGAA